MSRLSISRWSVLLGLLAGLTRIPRMAISQPPSSSGTTSSETSGAARRGPGGLLLGWMAIAAIAGVTAVGLWWFGHQTTGTPATRQSAAQIAPAPGTPASVPVVPEPIPASGSKPTGTQ
ncbi:MAG: hypothetical protein P9E24_11125 [Candidatus Competibacter sp.]|nr:hypothetical protein [Candidatus Competibacter sp.]MDG4582636.1 hypothetical protein [Candidatus Competibacter sp.]